ncbi:hypothetical protein RND81_11G126600 [Saponaria officinalis]|uniref:Sm domain-containing protein n=1 Tax=Saponaria officinalis TaxID=3572 RepID=A0AAW1HMZ0_SAPOF
MNLQQVVQPRYTNAFIGRKVVPSNRTDNKFQPGKSNVNKLIGAGIPSVSKGAGSESLPRDRLVYLTTCLIGHHVDVQVTNGSVYSGIFHAMDAHRDFGIILKMARLTKEVSFRGQTSGTDPASKAPSKTLIIPAHELVQVVAKDVAVIRDGISNEIQGETQQDILLDSYISQSRHVDAGRELEPWLPDDDASQCPELDNIFDSPWTGRSWDQFKVNEALFGVKSTFNEELYTTKLEKGPRMRELEEEARRIAGEIEGEETFDLHLAEERGALPHADFDIDEETKYSSVFRGFDDSGCADEDAMLDSRDMETFGDSSGPGFIRSFADVASGRSGKGLEGGRMSSGFMLKDELHAIRFNSSEELYRSDSQKSDKSMNALCGLEDDYRAQESDIDERGNMFTKETSKEEVQTVKSDDLHSSSVFGRDGSGNVGESSMTTASSTFGTKIENTVKVHFTEPSMSCGQVGSSASSESGVAASPQSAAALSPTSSVGSLSSEKSTLNPNAKEFRFNPKAKSFVPSQHSPLRPVSPVNDASFYYPATMSNVPHIHGMPVNIGGGQSFAGHQPVMYNLQGAPMQSQQAYYPASGPQYGQQVILGHPQQIMYMPGYPSGREF